MGCDIHVIVAYKEEGKDMEVIYDFDQWCQPYAGSDMLAEDKRWRDHRITRVRNYQRFAKLSGVRGVGPEANGWPKWAQHLPEFSDPDLHSHTHYPVKEAVQLWIDTEYPEDRQRDRQVIAKADPYWFYFRADPEKWNLDNVWVLISYDN